MLSSWTRNHRSSLWGILVLSAFLTGVTPGVARADGFFIPFVGWNFGGDSGTEFGDAVDTNRLNWGVSLGWMGGGVIGVEGEFSYSPDFFGETDTGSSSLWTAMGNVLVGVPFGGQTGFGIRPYGAAGIGAVKPNGDAFSTALSFTDTKVGWNFGGGVMMFFGTHVGIRGDLRYFRTFDAIEFLGIDIGDDDPGKLDFTRGSVGLILRF